MEWCKKKKKPKKGTSRRKENGKGKIVNAMGRKKTTRENNKVLRKRNTGL